MKQKYRIPPIRVTEYQYKLISSAVKKDTECLNLSGFVRNATISRAKKVIKQ